MKKNKILTIGFDLDGVILDNPIKTFRPLAKTLKFIKPVLFRQKKEPFYYPKTKLEKFLWWLLHKTSWRINPAFSLIEKLVKKRKIKAYIITGRYSCLKDDFEKWKNKLNRKKIFAGIFMNENDLQPNEFKIQMIKKLKLDIFVEDNWDIIEKLNSHTKAKIFWLTNLFDQFIPYPFKFKNLKEAIEFIGREKIF
jgi:uncharacterized HAD superfamily protein